MRRPPYPLFAALALAGGLVALWLAPPVAGFGDGSELMLVLARDGVAHPTGYPLYTILGHGAVVLLHALGMGWARAAAAWSAAGAAVALWFLQLLAWQWARLASERAPEDASAGASAGTSMGTARAVAAMGAFAALVLAFDPIWLEQATTAEVYTWHIAWACAAAWCALGPAHRPDARASALLGFVLGIGLAHHRSAVFLALPLAVAWTAAAWRSAGARAALTRAGLGVAAALVPLTSFGWIAWRAFHPGPAQWPALDRSWAAVWHHVLGGQYRDLLGRFAPDAEAQSLLQRYGYPVLAPALLLLAGLAVRAWRARADDRATTLAIAAAAFLATGWAFLYGVPDPEAYFLLPAVLGLATLAPVVANARRARGAGPQAPGRVAAARGLAALAALGLAAWASVGVRAALADRTRTVESDRVVRLMWQSLPADSSLVFWPDDPYVRLEAYQQLDGEKPTLYVMTPAFLGFPAVRRSFAARFGFDPMADFQFTAVRAGSPEEAHALELLYRDLLLHVSARTSHAVYVMIPEQGILRTVPKDRDPQGTLTR